MFEEFKNAFSRPNNAHIQLIIINVVVFVVLGIILVLPTVFGFENIFIIIHKQFVIPPTIDEFLTRPWTIITYAFAHDLSGLFHILFNMLALYWFGRLFVEYLGSDKLIALYILGALAAAGFYLLMFNTVPYFVSQSNSFPGMVGASGAIFAIMVGAATLLPDYTFLLLFFGPVRIKYIAAVYIFISFLGSVGTNAGGNLAHLGGALMGFIYIKQLQSGVNLGSWITSILQGFKNLFKPRSKVKVSYRKSEPRAKSSSEKPSQAEIDAILDKISDRGYESLSKDEKEKLFNSSKK
ncbi:MAG: rhomboid family intramembrane serine protease [Cyclobacteriaceae bacterium]